MKVTGLPQWGVRVEPGDTLRSNATYDTTIQSTYENMGIAIAFIAPDAPDGAPSAPGVDPFAPGTAADTSANCDSGGVAAGALCDKGVPTHGHLAENDNFGGAEGGISAQRGSPTDRVDIAAFLYAPGDLSMISMTGIPTARPGQKVTFTNFDTGIDVYHSVTSCTFPAPDRRAPRSRWPTAARASGATSTSTLGNWASVSPRSPERRTSATWDLDLSGYQSGEFVSYYCRIHPFMRGVLEVTP